MSINIVKYDNFNRIWNQLYLLFAKNFPESGYDHFEQWVTSAPNNSFALIAYREEIEDGTFPVGMVTCQENHASKHIINLGNLCVDQEYRNKNIGKMLMSKVEEIVSNSRYYPYTKRVIELYTHKHMLPFYKKLGYSKTFEVRPGIGYLMHKVID